MDVIFEEQPYLSNVYPSGTRSIGIIFQIRQEHCLHCGNCYELCPVKAVERRYCI